MPGTARKMEIVSPGERRFGLVGSVVVTSLIVAAIVLTTLAFAVRTEGGRAFVAERLSRRVGMTMHIEGARIGWPYALVVEGPATQAAREGQPAFRAQRLRVSMNWKGRCALRVERAELVLVEERPDAWRPAWFSRLGGLPSQGVVGIENVTAPFRERWTLEVVDSAMRWIDASGEETASVTGLYARVAPTTIPGHRMYYGRLAFYSYVHSGRRLMDVEREWLMSDRRPYIELSAAGDRGGDAAAWFSGAVGGRQNNRRPGVTHGKGMVARPGP